MKEIDKNVLGVNIRRLRKKFFLSQDNLAKLIGKKLKYVSQVELGDRLPTREILEKTAEVLKVTPAVLEGRVGDSKNLTRLDHIEHLKKLDELETNPIQLREYLLEHVYQFDTEKLLNIVNEEVYKI